MIRATVGMIALAVVGGAAWLSIAGASESGERRGDAGAKPTSQPTTSPAKENTMNLSKATFAAGCFWGVQSRFDAIKGVERTTVGYTGGKTENPTYKQVCTDETGHAEAILVEYDPNVVSYDQLLEVFWTGHNPTQLNRQGPDIGSQYRSAIFYHSPEQKAAAEASKEKLDKSGKFGKPIVTLIVPAVTFFAAEEYHQKYLAKRGMSSCGTGGH